MTIFQAYCNSTDGSGIWRFILTFPSSIVADEWWRAFSDTLAVAASLTRINPQFYTNDVTVFNIYDFFTDPRTQALASQFHGQFFMTMIDDKNGRDIPVVENRNVANAISGNGFFICSESDPALYWYYDPDNKDHPLSASSAKRSRFIISAVDPNTVGKVLIGTDLVTLQIEYLRNPMYINVKDDTKQLFADTTAKQFLLKDLLTDVGFDQYQGVLLDESSLDTGNTTDGMGWHWELIQ